MGALECDPESRRYRVASHAVAACTLAGVIESYFGHLESWLRERPGLWVNWQEFERVLQD